jgi:hypothetical protein
VIKPDHAAEAIRRRERTEQERSPGQRTARSTNKARAHKYPGKRNRASQERKEMASYGYA